MAVKVVLGYLAARTNGETSFSVSWDGASNSFSVDGDLNAATNNISRLDFLDPGSTTGAPLAVIPCVAQGSSFKLQSSNLCSFNLPLNSLLGGPAQLSVTGNLCALQGNLYFSTPAQVGMDNGAFSLQIGGVDPDPLTISDKAVDGEFGNVLQGLSATGQRRQGQQWIDDPEIKVADTNAPTPFGICFGRDFFSDHITCHVRSIDAGSGSPLPVLTIRRQFGLKQAINESAPIQFPPPFALSVSADKDGSGVHAAQFPSLDWLTTMPAAGQGLREAAQWHVEISGLSGQSINQFWSESVVTPYLAGLASVNDVLPISVLPSLQLAPTNDANQDFFWRICATVSAPTNPGGELTLGTFRMVPGGVLAPEQPVNPYTAATTLDAFRLHSGNGLPINATVGLTAIGDGWYANPFGQDICEIHFTLQVQSFREQVLRLGALDLSLGALAPPTTPTVVSQLECIVTFGKVKLNQQFRLGMNAGDAWFPQVYVSGSLPAFRYVPAGEDALPQTASDAILNPDLTTSQADIATAANFSRNLAIVLDLNANEANAQQLTVLESSRTNTSAPHSQQLVFRLNATSSNATFGPVMVLDRQQFLVAKIQLNPTNADSTGEEIGVWCNLFPEGPGWRISGGATGFQLSLPPQTIGEEMERIAGDMPDGETVNYRYSPALNANLLGSYDPQNYVQPAWDLRSILGYAQQRAPGTGVDSAAGISFELLHGITTTVTAPNLRLSEIFARLGDFPGPLPTSSELQRIHPEFTPGQVDAVSAMAQNWSLHYRQLLSRPAVLELWDEQQGADLLLDDGVACDVRANALYDPSPSLPLPTGVVPPLKAGVGFALESENLVTELKRSLTSTDAHLARPRFSALGGWGDQKATFAKGKIIVESRTEMGRLSSLSVILVGRIGVCWNRALHVTVYERTVLPSRQFYLEQDQLRGRPILRKVREYVQIMEPIRAYPESSSSPLARGFIAGSTFKSTTINVDSTWGGDVGSSGWQVPLWRPDAVPTDIYPRPHINLTVEVDPAVGVDTMQAEILDPDKLCFYTDTSDDTTSDTDTWNAVQEIDFTDAAPIRTIDASQPSPNPASAALAAAGKDPSIEPGFGRFTYNVAPIAGQTNVVAQRTGQAIGASLNNVSMMRGNPVANPAIPAAGDLRQATGRVRDWWTGMVQQLGQMSVPSNAHQPEIDAAKAQVTQMLSTGGMVGALLGDLSNVQTLAKKSCQAVSDRLQSGLGQFTSITENLLSDALQKFSSDLKTTLNTMAGQAGTTAQQLKDYVNGTFAAVLGTLAPFKQSLTDAQATLKTICTDTVAKLQQTQTQLVFGSNQLAAAVTQLQTQLDWYSNTMTAACQAVVGNGGNQLTVELDYQFTIDVGNLPSLVAMGSADLQTVLGSVNTALGTLITAISNKDAACQAAAAALGNVELQAEADLIAMQNALITLIQNTSTNLGAALTALYANYKILSDNVTTQEQQIESWLTTPFANLSATATALCNTFALDLSNVATDLANTLQQTVTPALTSLITDATSYAQALDAIGQQVAGQLDDVYNQALNSLSSVPVPVPTFVQPGSALRLLRAFGDPPQVPTTSFSLPSLAYFFDDTDPRVLMTQVTTGITQAAKGLATQTVQGVTAGLNQLGLSMPSVGLLDRILPADLTSFNISSIFPSFAGLNLAGLFSGVTLPDAANQNIHVTHKIDPQTLRATLDADIDIPLAGSSNIFDIGPVCLNLIDADLQAHVHISAGAGQQTTQTSSGSISGQWELRIGGMILVTFLDTTLSFDESGSLQFSIKPENVQLASALQFVTQFLSALDFGDSGFSLNILPDPKVQCILDLPLPDMGGGTFAIMNLSLGALFEIGLNGGDFYATVGANLGRQVAPFDLTIFILGGAGWFETNVTYTKGAITGSVSVGMAASAALEITLGPISGSVAIYFGIFANLQIGGGGGFQLGIMILVTGQVSLLGIIDVSISLLLEAEYTSGGGLTGTGTVSISIKICWCFTLSVNEGVQYTFGAAASTNKSATQHIAALAESLQPAATTPPFYSTYRAAAVDYVTMLA